MGYLFHQLLMPEELLKMSLKKPGATEFVARIFVFALANFLRRDSADNFKRFDIFGNYGTGCNHRSFANFDSRQNDTSWTNKNIIFDFDRLLHWIKSF